ncbi:MAG: preprotein translocase subunit SecA [Akkermansia sp.]
MISFLTAFLGNKNEREVRKLKPVVAKINELEKSLINKSADDLRAMTREWQNYLHRFLPLVIPSGRVLREADAAQRKQWAQEITDRFNSLRPDFPTLPKSIEPSPEAIEGAKQQFHAIEGQFPRIRNKYLDHILPMAFAVVKNAARKLCGQTANVCGLPMVWDMIHFDTQLLGGIALHRGYIAEMATGEGKTLVSTLPVYLNALTGLGVHMVTVNDYLARRDSQWMGFLYHFLGISVGCIENQLPEEQRSQQYLCDITYGTNSEFGFDYLRDNGIATSIERQVQRGHYFALIDEVDSVLIDEARTPLIISGPASAGDGNEFITAKPVVERLFKQQTLLCNELVAQAQRTYESGDEKAAGRILYKVKLGQPRNRMFLRLMENPDLLRLVEKTELRILRGASKQPLVTLKEELFFVVDLKRREAELMEKGRQFLSPGDPSAFIIPDMAKKLDEAPRPGESRETQIKRVRQELATNAGSLHATSQMLKAYCLFEKDVEYVIRDGEVVIVDEHTGREMPGRRWSDGLHQAVTAKEDLEMEEDNLTYATITIQNYFRLYEKLAGMTGTAETEAAEFHDIYKLDVLPIPTHKPCMRQDLNALIFKTRRDKYTAAISRINQIHQTGQPILVGTASVDASETLSRMMQRSHIAHVVLNAKNHMSEAEIVTRAGQKGAVTISTNMAGRGTDIKLGQGVEELGGLFVLGTEHYESRRIDRQLRGRAARQGDPGQTQFYISLEDELLRNFGDTQEAGKMLDNSQEEAEQSVKIPTSATVENAQRQIELRNCTWRKRVLDFDDVMNTQRNVLYSYRNEILRSDCPQQLIFEVLDEVIPVQISEQLASWTSTTDKMPLLLDWLSVNYPLPLDIPQNMEGKQDNEIIRCILQAVKDSYISISSIIPEEYMEYVQRNLMLHVIDTLWQEHLSSMEELREGVNLRATGQKDPLIEYKTDAFVLFEQLMDDIKTGIMNNMFNTCIGMSQAEGGVDVESQVPPAEVRKSILG